MFNLDAITNENNKDYNRKWPYIPDHLYRMLIIGSSGSGKTNSLLNFIKEQASDNLVDKIYLYPKDVDELKYQLGKVLSDKAKSKEDKVVETHKRDKTLVYNLRHSFVKFKDISDFKEMSLDSMHKKLNEFRKKLDLFKNMLFQNKEK